MKGLLSGGAVRVGRIFGIPIFLHWSWFPIVAVFSLALFARFSDQLPESSGFMLWLLAVAGVLGFLISVLAHELCHSLMALHLGLRVDRITLMLFGGVSQIEDKALKRDPGTELKITIVGPLCSLVLGVVFLAVDMMFVFPSALHYLFVWLGFINIVLGVFNLLPGFPMDGGRVLRAILWWRTKNLLRATKIAFRVGIGVAYLLPIAGFLWGGLFTAVWVGAISWFLIVPAAKSELQRVQLEEILGGVLVRDLMYAYRDSVSKSDVLALFDPLAVIMFCQKYDGVLDVLRDAAQKSPNMFFVCDGEKVIGNMHLARVELYLKEHL